MNKKQKIILWVSITIIGLMVIFPPVYYGAIHVDGSDGDSHTYSAEGPYGFLFDDPAITHLIKYDILFIQCALVIIIGGISIYILRDKKTKD